MSTKQFERAIVAHVGWIARFRNALSGLDRERLNQQEAADHTACEFGRWLHQNPDFFDPSEYEYIAELHRVFHEEAGRIAAMVESGLRNSAGEAIGGVLNNLSKRLIEALQNARDHYANGKAGA